MKKAPFVIIMLILLAYFFIGVVVIYPTEGFPNGGMAIVIKPPSWPIFIYPQNELRKIFIAKAKITPGIGNPQNYIVIAKLPYMRAFDHHEEELIRSYR